MFSKASNKAHVVLALETSLDGVVGIHYVVRRQGLERVRGGWMPTYTIYESRRAESPEDVEVVSTTLVTWARLYEADCVSVSLAHYARRRKVRLPSGLPVVDLGRMR